MCRAGGTSRNLGWEPQCLQGRNCLPITAVDFPNLEFEFAPEKLNEFVEGL